ncbi:unnamed protein product [Penicillium nalgiovense]|nr:unnamed protein product [Penicillium nalgiovense]CAG8106438.1 unnamed protein product [Penicillium nalgiovense]
MEPAGLTVGILGLAGLFNTCLDVLEKVDSWKGFGSESRSMSAQFKDHKIRLEKWGQAVGIEQGRLSDEHDRLLDDPRILSTVQELLSAIKDICGYDDNTFPTNDLGYSMTINKQKSRCHARPQNPHESKRLKLSWALRDKAKRIAQVEQISLLVQNLHGLVPINGVRGATAKYEESTSSGDPSKGLNDVQTWLLGNHLPNQLYETFVEKKIEGTCEWILSRPWFLDWSSPNFPIGSPKILWINGPAGFGKSILCTNIICHLSSKKEAPVAHFFFSSDFESRGDPFMAVESWLAQLMSHPLAFPLIRERWAAQQGQKATRWEIINILQEIVKTIPECTFILDGLDECNWFRESLNTGDDDCVSGFLEALRRATTGTTTRIMIFSRDEPEIRTALSTYTKETSFFEHRITPEDVQSDVLSYSRSIVHKKLPKKTGMIREDISQKLADRCNGQFLWIKMQEASLRSGKNQKQLEQAINSTPTGLEHIYERNWIKISQLPEEDRDRAFSLLRWTTFAVRPLTICEMTEALVISEHNNEVRVDELPDDIDVEYIDTEISYYCGSLLDVRSPQSGCYAGLRTVHLAHFSVKEFLLHKIPPEDSLRCFTESIEKTLLAKLCLRYVNCPTVWRKNSHVEDGPAIGSLLNYAAGSWRQHACFGNSNSPLYYAALLGLTQTVSFLIQHGKHRLNEKGILGRTALLAACEKGNIKITEMLLENGADVTIPDNEGRQPVYVASWDGHIEIVQLLLERNVDVNIMQNYGWTPVNLASDQGHTEVVKLLLEHGADIRIANNNGWTPVNSASDKGHMEVVKLLVEHGADITVANNDGWTPVNAASFHGHVEVVKLLLEHGADVTFANNNGWTPVNSASDKGHMEVVKLLLEHRADITVANNQ